MPRPSQGFASSSKLLEKKWQENRYKAHQQKMRKMHTKVDVRPPKQYPHLVLRLKKVQKEEERQSKVDHDNQLLLQKITHILRKKGRVDNWNDYEPRSLNQELREREQEKIAQQNIGIARRLESVKPIYDVEAWDERFKDDHDYYLDLWNKDTKDFDMSPRGPHQRRGKDWRKRSEWDYEDDFENDDDNRSGRLPSIHSRDAVSGTTNRSQPNQSGGQTTKLPKIKTGRDVIAEQDAKLLFKASKQLVTPGEAINRALIRKTHSQRMATKARFKEMYDLNLMEELQNVVSKDFDMLLDCLLTERESADAEAVNQAIYDNTLEDLVTLFCSRNSAAISSINKAYKKAFEASIEEDIEDKIVDIECQYFLKLLIKPGRAGGEVEESLADQDALDLFEAGRDRFTDEDGVFMRIMSRRSMPQIRATFINYKMVSGGESIIDSMENDGCSKDYIRVVETLNKSMFSGGAYYAQILHDNMGPGNRDLVNTLLARSEIDMASIRKAYKKKYGTELVDDLINRCGEIGPYLAQIAAKGAVQQQAARGNKGGNASNSQAQGRRINGMVIGGQQQKRHQVKRPDHLDQKDPGKANPLNKKTTRGGGTGATGGGAAAGGAGPANNKGGGGGGAQARHESGGAQGRPESGGGGRGKQQSGDGARGKQESGGGAKGRKESGGAKRRQDSGDSTSGGKATVKKGGTVKASPDFDVDDDVDRIHEAMKGFGTNEEPIIEIIAHRDNAQRQKIRKKYPAKYDDKDLIEALKSELRGDFEELIMALMMTPLEYDVHSLHDAIDGLGTREAALIGIICSRTGKELKDIQGEYSRKHRSELRDDIADDTSGDFKNLLMELLKGERKQGDAVDRKLAATEGNKLHKGGDNLLDVQTPEFLEILTKRSHAQVKATLDAYKRISGQTLAEGIKEAMLGDEEEAYIGLVEAISDPVDFYARRLGDSMKGAGTNDKQLIRIVVSRSEIDLADIKARFKELHKSSLEESIEDECSGDYKRLLVELVKEK